MASSDSVDFGHYVKWALSVTEPMIIEYAKRKDYVTVEIPADFITADLCKECDEDGPHITPDHIFRIILTSARDGSHELRIFNDLSNNCNIPANSKAFKSLVTHVCARGNQCYFYGKVDEDDGSKLYINIENFPTQ